MWPAAGTMQGEGMAPRLARTAAFVALLVLIPACTTQRARHATPSGFLDDYGALRPGGQDEAVLVWKALDLDLAAYDRVMLDPLVVWYSDDAAYRGIHPEVLADLADHFHATVLRALGDAYPVVAEPGPGVVRIRAAITGVKPSRPLLDAATNVPPARAVDLGTSLLTGSHLFVGEAAIEAEFLDAESGRRMLALVDRRKGGKTPVGVAGRWTDARQAFDYWADKLRERLDAAHGR
jgi:hypothetical protein